MQPRHNGPGPALSRTSRGLTLIKHGYLPPPGRLLATSLWWPTAPQFPPSFTTLFSASEPKPPLQPRPRPPRPPRRYFARPEIVPSSPTHLLLAGAGQAGAGAGRALSVVVRAGRRAAGGGRGSVRAWFLISLFAAEQLHSMLSSYGRSSLPPPFSDRRPSLQSAAAPAAPGHPITSLLAARFPAASILPVQPGALPGLVASRLPSSSPTRDPEPQFPAYHPAAFASYQNSLKLKKKKQRTTKIGPDGIPLKRKSREGSTTYLWEFLLKLLQVSCENNQIFLC